MPTLAELLATPTAEDVSNKLLAGLNVDGWPVTDWYSGGVARTLTESVGAAIADLVGNLIPTLAAGGLLEEATGEWLTILLQQNYGVIRTEATYTRQLVQLTTASGAGPYSVAAGDLIVESEAGRRYVLAEDGTLSSAGPVTLEFVAESPGGAYNDGAGQVTRLITAKPGVTVNNVAQAFSPVTHLGTGLGTMTVSAPGLPPTPTTVSVRVTQTGQVGAARIATSLQGGPYVERGLASATVDITGTGIRLAFVNAASANPSFIFGDRYLFTTPGSPIQEQGRDVEQDEAARARGRARWPSLALVETTDKYQLWAQAADPQVTKVTITPSPSVPGQVDVVIAGAANPLGGPVVTAVQDYIDQRAGITEIAAVVAATAVTVTTAGTVTVRSRERAAVQAAAQAAWGAYIAALPIGGVARASELYQAVMDAGAVDAVALTLAGGTAVDLAYNEVGQSGNLSSGLIWAETV